MPSQLPMADEHQEPVNEYEREPVPASAQLGLKSFVGQYAGEHVAGTELMIGPLFFAAGASAFDLIVGLSIVAFTTSIWMLRRIPAGSPGVATE